MGCRPVPGPTSQRSPAAATAACRFRRRPAGQGARAAPARPPGGPSPHLPVTALACCFPADGAIHIWPDNWNVSDVGAGCLAHSPCLPDPGPTPARCRDLSRGGWPSRRPLLAPGPARLHPPPACPMSSPQAFITQWIASHMAAARQMGKARACAACGLHRLPAFAAARLPAGRPAFSATRPAKPGRRARRGARRAGSERRLKPSSSALLTPVAPGDRGVWQERDVSRAACCGLAARALPDMPAAQGRCRASGLPAAPHSARSLPPPPQPRRSNALDPAVIEKERNPTFRCGGAGSGAEGAGAWQAAQAWLDCLLLLGAAALALAPPTCTPPPHVRPPPQDRDGRAEQEPAGRRRAARRQGGRRGRALHGRRAAPRLLRARAVPAPALCMPVAGSRGRPRRSLARCVPPRPAAVLDG